MSYDLFALFLKKLAPFWFPFQSTYFVVFSAVTSVTLSKCVEFRLSLELLCLAVSVKSSEFRLEMSSFKLAFEPCRVNGETVDKRLSALSSRLALESLRVSGEWFRKRVVVIRLEKLIGTDLASCDDVERCCCSATYLGSTANSLSFST